MFLILFLLGLTHREEEHCFLEFRLDSGANLGVRKGLQDSEAIPLG